MRVESSGWSGEGGFTGVVLGALKAIEAIEFIRIEDAPASRTESGYAFLSNEVYVTFRTESRVLAGRRLALPWRTRTIVKVMTLNELGSYLGRVEGVGVPDYSDDDLLQYLRTERIVAPHQTNGFKVVEMVRIYEAGIPPRA
jgi:hypothetical protein